MIIYGSSIGISMILFLCFKFIFKTNQFNSNTNNKKIKVCQICGYLIYSEKKKNERAKEVKANIPCEWFRLPCQTIGKCCDKSICDFLCCQMDENEEDKFHCCFSCCYECKCCCSYCKCETINEDDYNEFNDIFYCHCYKIKRKIKWFDMFLNNDTQIQLTKIMLNYFILKLITLGFDKIYLKNVEELKKKDNTYKNILDLKNMFISCGIFLLIIIIFFYITISWGRYIKKEPETKESDNIENLEVQKLSEDILQGSTVIIIFNSVFSLIFTLFYFSSLTYLVTDINNYFIYIPILMNKFYFFTFTYYCLKTAEKTKGIDLVSGSTLITIYISIWNLITGVISNLFSNHILFSIQLLPSSIITLLFLSLIAYNLFCRGIFWRTFLYIFFYFFACGGCWFFGCCCKCCRNCCYCFETPKEFNSCCKCGVFDKCCEHEECINNKYKTISKNVSGYFKRLKQKLVKILKK